MIPTIGLNFQKQRVQTVDHEETNLKRNNNNYIYSAVRPDHS